MPPDETTPKFPPGHTQKTFAALVRKGFVTVRERAEAAAVKSDPNTAEIYREWEELLEAALGLWEKSGSRKKSAVGMIESAIDATIISAASIPYGGEKRGNGGLVRQWTNTLCSLDPTALSRTAASGHELARRVAIAIVSPDNQDRRIDDDAEVLDEVAAELLAPNEDAPVRNIEQVVTEFEALMAAAEKAVDHQLIATRSLAVAIMVPAVEQEKRARSARVKKTSTANEPRVRLGDLIEKVVSKDDAFDVVRAVGDILMDEIWKSGGPSR